MGKLVLIALVSLMAMGVAGRVAFAQGSADTATYRETFAFDVYNPCNNDLVHVTGEFESVDHTTNDADGGTHDSFVSHTHGYGIGESGAEYRVNGGFVGVSNFTQDSVSQGGEETSSDTLRVVSKDGTDNFLVHTLFHLTYDANGTLTTRVQIVDTKCEG